MSHASPAVSSVKVTSALGTSFWVSTDSASDYILHPAFLRFLVIAITIYAVTRQGDSGPRLLDWQLFVAWFAVAGAMLLGFVFILTLLFRLTRRGTIQSIYTTVIFVPIYFIAEAIGQIMLWLLDVPDRPPMGLEPADVARDLIVVFLFDLLHSQYVVHAHPLAYMSRPDTAPPAPAATETTLPPLAPQPAAPDTAPATAEPDLPPAGPDRAMVQIADKVFALADLLYIRTEDHYLNVITRTGRSMLRAKLSDIPALHDGRHGVQINRSQWVAFSAIETVTDEDNGQVTLHLSGGDSATVARTRRLMFMQLYTTPRGRQT